MGEKIEFKPSEEDALLMKDGKSYRLRTEVVGKDQHTKKLIFEEVNEEEWRERRKKVADYLVNKSNLTAQTVVEDILKRLPLEEIEKLEKRVREKKAVRIKNGCLSLICGRVVVDIV